MQIDPKAIGSLLLGWFVPGLGHVYQKKYWKGGIFFVCILSMAALGLFMGGKIYSFQTENPLTILGLGNLKNTTFEFGTAYIAGAGLLNYLVALDAFDIASGKKE